MISLKASNVNVDSIGSNRSLEKSAFHFEGCLRKRSYVKKEFSDVNLWALIKDDTFRNKDYVENAMKHLEKY